MTNVIDAVNETTVLIVGRNVSGARVYNPTGECIGSIYDVMIDKTSDKIVWALMAFGVGTKWPDSLSYITRYCAV